MVIWLVTILLVVAGVWSYVGQIDIVAVANGRISTEGSTKIIQPAISGVVTKINTREGQEVKKGDVLIELDKTTSEKEVMTLVQGVAVARVERDILRRLAVGGVADDIVTQAELPEEVKSVLREFAQARQGLIQARQQTLHGAISQQQQQVQFNQHTKQRLEANMQQLQQRKRELESQLAQANPVERIGLQNELGSLEQRIAAAESAVLGQGQRVVVKLATYPFQRYGYLEGEVETISPDAIHDEKKGLVYKAKIKLKNATSSKQAELTLLPGMSVSAEITTGKRRIVEFFLDPLLTKVDGSIKVR
ncbi:MAG: biotin/lipoyl-binding protein [Candidatus Saccharibacteria bacterium]|nr:biotin/lipoyl-binding protein [Candidatus Saccharibacteria bacterium]